jgi:hypothetical protein
MDMKKVLNGDLRLLPGKPIRFSTGELAPRWADVATGFGFFAVVVFGLSLVLIFGLRRYERVRRRHLSERQPIDS